MRPTTLPSPNRSTYRRSATRFTLLLCSCNQGNSTGSSQLTPPALAQPDIAIDGDNAILVAQAGVRGGMDLMRLSYIGAHFLQTSFPQPGEPDPTAPQPPIVTGTVKSIEVYGPEEGVATFTWDDVNEDEKYSSGDLFTINFQDYGAQGLLLNGIMTIDNVQLLGLLPGDGTYVVDATLNLLGLTLRIGALTQTFNTELPFHMENRIIVEIFDLILFDSQVIGALEIQPGTRLMRFTTDNDVRYSLDGVVHSAQLEGELRFTTPTGLRGSPFLNEPTEGTMLIRGRNGSALEIEPFCFLPGICISLDVRVDEDGDKEFETQLSSSWQSLLPQ